MTARKARTTRTDARGAKAIAGSGPAAGGPPTRAEQLAPLARAPVGQVSQALAGALAQGRVSHAYLFAVLNPGFGAPEHGMDRATACALSFARRLNCEAPRSGNACGACLSCQLIDDGNHPDVRIVSPEGLSVKIDQIREIKKEMSLKPRRDGGFRVTIIEGAEKMTTEAQNSLLKLLEEPPDRAVFVLVSQNPSGLLPTVRSRCQVVRLRAAGGETEEGFRGFVDTVRRARAMSPLEVLEEAEAVERALHSDGSQGGGEPRQRLEGALVAAVTWFRDVLVLKSTGDAKLVCGGAAELAQDAAAFSAGELIQVIDRIEEARRQVRRNANMRLALEAMLFTLKRDRAREDEARPIRGRSL